ncbi:MAG: cyclic dehypoxanthinyl futalosine synthase [Planctomycetota bacterium]
MSPDEIVEKAIGGERIAAEDVAALFDKGDLLALGQGADRICRLMHPEPYRTYAVDRNINYSNICISRCRFCAFHRSLGSKDAYVLSREDLFDKIEETIAFGGTHILMQGGLHPDLKIDFFENLSRAIKERSDIHLHCLSPPEIVHIARLSGLTIADCIARLRNAGLDTIPGGGAEILADEVRRKISPNKCTTSEWLAVMRTAHDLGMRTTATMMFGHVETPAHRVEHLMRIRDLQDETGGFTAFIPWTFQPENTGLDLPQAGAFDYLRTLAISRLALDNVANLQASWVTQGAKIGQLALRFGANDMGGTMIEENVVRAAGVEFQMTRDDVVHLIEDAGFEARQRNVYYEIVSPAVE